MDADRNPTRARSAFIFFLVKLSLQTVTPSYREKRLVLAKSTTSSPFPLSTARNM
jgi:hypothetical protein